MKILAIRGNNLTALIGNFEVDFEQEPLNSAGIFAITGKTGAGKSTLLDAICVALYNKIPRNNNASNVQLPDGINQTDPRTLLSKGTGSGFAEVKFKGIDNEIYESRWSVRRARNSATGALQGIDITFSCLSNEQEFGGTNQEKLAAIQERVGLSFDQFTRSILLAQGDFATFLKANENDKAALLEKLTGTEVYSEISRRIFEKFREAESAKKKIEDIIGTLTTTLLSEEELIAKQSRLSEINELISHNEADSKALNEAISWERTRLQLTQHLHESEALLRSSQQIHAQSEERFSFLKQFDEAQQYRDLFNHKHNMQERISEKNEEIERLESDLKSLSTKLIELQSAIERVSGDYLLASRDLEEMQPKLHEARRIEGELTLLVQHKTQANSRMQQSRAQLNSRKQARLNTEQEVIKLNEELVATQYMIERYTQLTPVFNAFTDVISTLDRLIQHTTDYNNKSERLKELQDKLTNNKLSTQSNNEQLAKFTHSISLEVLALRNKLVVGEACPVCGLVTQTIPTSNNAFALSNEELMHTTETLTTKQQDLALEERELSSRLKSTQEEQEALARALETDHKLLDQVFEANPKIASMHRDTQLRENLIKAKELFDQNSRKLVELEHGNDVLAQNLKATTSDIEALSKQLSLDETEYASVLEKEKMATEKIMLLLNGKSADETEKTLLNTANGLRIRLEEYKTAFAERSQAKKIREEQLEIGQRTLSEFALEKEKDEKKLDQINASGSFSQPIETFFIHEAEWANRERATLNEITQNLTQANVIYQERTEKLAEHMRQKVRENEASLEEMIENEAIFAKRKNDLTDEKTQMMILLQKHKDQILQISELMTQSKEKEELFNNWSKLNDLLGSAQGDKFKKLAQGYTLTQLLSYANYHLSMLSNRYRLQQVGDTLNMQIEDLDMGNEIRSVISLSGGETFLVSLALALALSSLSSDRLAVESLFIDEGFGSLDVDTLSIAMDALERLHQEGRKVGVISHVTEMSERINTKIQVTKQGNGTSRIEIIG